jgi:predicted XRE-type DNA-binding protein
MSDSNLHIEVFDRVWDAIELTKADAANMKVRDNLMIAIRKIAGTWQATQETKASEMPYKNNPKKS